MSDKAWVQFFSLLGLIVDMPGKSADEKAAIVRDKAGQDDDDLRNLNEFVSWDFSYPEDDEGK